MIRHILALGVIVATGCSTPLPNKTSGHLRNIVSEPTFEPTLEPQTIHQPVIDPIAAPLAKPDAETESNNSAEVVATLPQSILPLSYQATSSQGIIISAVYFDDRKFQLQVADQPDGCGSKWLDAKSAALSRDGLAAINAGFFTPEGKPLGVLVESGVKRGHLNQTSLGAGIFVSTTTTSNIIRRESYSSSSLVDQATNLLQAGPILIDHGKPTNGLSDQNNRPRSFIAWDGNHHWMIGHINSSTLSGAAKALAENGSMQFKPTIALNLDGGRSSDLWVGPQVANGDKTHRTFLNKAVRNYLVLTPR